MGSRASANYSGRVDGGSTERTRLYDARCIALRLAPRLALRLAPRWASGPVSAPLCSKHTIGRTIWNWRPSPASLGRRGLPLVDFGLASSSSCPYREAHPGWHEQRDRLG